MAPQDTYLAFMMDYAAGNQPEAIALAGDLHVMLSDGGRRAADIWSAVGGVLLESAGATAQQQIPDLPESPKVAEGRSQAGASRLLAMAEEPLRWRRGLSGVAYVPLGTPGAKFMKLERGQSAPAHGHGGLEATVVLHGRFSDGHGIYERGDIVLAVPGMRHKPRGEGAEPCICFVAERPNRLSWLF